MRDQVRDNVVSLCHTVAQAGGRALLVGGWVRDHLLGLDTNDVDVEVFGVPPERLLQLLQQDHDLDLVGASFGVLKLKGQQVDVSIPRRDSRQPASESGEKINPHRAFLISADPGLSVREAALRRDFTINTIAYDPLIDVFEDPYDGRRDLRDGVLRHTSDRFFADDPLRVLRGMQMVARFDLRVHPDTLELCRRMDLDGLSRERLMGEWSKLLLQGRRISRGLRFLQDAGQLDAYPELAALVGCPQDPEWHPEGDVWVHTGHCLDFYATQRTQDRYEDLVVGFAVLCHDLGKPATTRREGGRWRALRHATEGLEPTKSFLRRLTSQRNLLDDVLPLVKYHLVPRELHVIRAGDAALRRLARRVGRIDRLARVSAADAMGRPPLSDWREERKAFDWLLQRAEALRVLDAAPEAILKGRHVLELGVEPGPGVGEMVRACYEAQLDGKVTTLEEALAFARQRLGDP